MFPYTSVPLVIAWTMVIFLFQGFEIQTFIILIVSLVAIKHYYNAPLNKGAYAKASAIALNVALLPLIFINIIFTPYIFTGKRIGEVGLAYVLPMIYSPIIYLFILTIAYLYLWRKV